MGLVKLYPPRLSTVEVSGNLIRNAAPIMGGDDWSPWGAACNWMNARGATLVSAPGAADEEINVEDGALYRYWIWPHALNITRVWHFGLACPDDVAETITGTVTLEDATTAEWRIPAGTRADQEVRFKIFQTIDPPSGADQQAFIWYQRTDLGADTNPYVTSHRCEELPRTFHEELLDEQTCLPQRLIYQSDSPLDQIKSAHAVGLHMEIAKELCRRAHLLTFFYPPGIEFDLGTFAAFLPTSIGDVPIQPRHLHNGETTRSVPWVIYAGATGGDGEVRLTAASGDTDTITVDEGAAGWYGGTIELNTEDPSTLDSDGGLRGGVRDTIVCEARVTTATTLNMYGLNIGGDEP